jgi:hypothetical protein
MSFLPLGIIIVLIIGVGYFLLKGDIKLPNFNKGPQIGRLEGFPTVIDTTKDLIKVRKVLKSEVELAEFLNTVDGSNQLSVKEKIDWNKQFVIAVTTDTNDESGHRIKVAKVYEDKKGKSLLISLGEVAKGKGCDVQTGKNIAIDLVTITKTDFNIDFERTRSYETCESASPVNTSTAPKTNVDTAN